MEQGQVAGITFSHFTGTLANVPVKWEKVKEDYSRPMEQGQVAGITGSSDATGPMPCQMELNMHGSCVENYFRKSMSRGTDYTAYVQKCSDSRKLFDKCMDGWKKVEAGQDDMKTGEKVSAKASSHFAVSG